MPKRQVKKKKGKSSSAIKKRSQKVNKQLFPGTNADTAPIEAGEGPSRPMSVCVNMECKLRRAGCYGYEGCPGYKAKE